MAFQSSLKLSRFDLPNLDGSIFRAGGQLGELRVKCHICDGTFMPFHLKFGRYLRNVKVFNFQIGCLLSIAIAPGELLLETLDFLL